MSASRGHLANVSSAARCSGGTSGLAFLAASTGESFHGAAFPVLYEVGRIKSSIQAIAILRMGAGLDVK